MCEADFVNTFQQPGPECFVHPVNTIHHLPRRRIAFQRDGPTCSYGILHAIFVTLCALVSLW
jgi:hypothetical protein